MIVASIAHKVKTNNAKFGTTFVKTLAYAAKTKVRPDDDIAKLVTNSKFMQRLVREFMQKRLKISLQKPEILQTIVQPTLANYSKTIKNSVNSVGSFIEKTKRPVLYIEGFKNSLLEWFKKLGENTLKRVRTEQSKLITTALNNAKETAQKLKYAASVNEVNIFQKNLHRNLANSQFNLELKKADYAKHPSAKNKYFLEMAQERFNEIKAIVKKARAIAKVKKDELIKIQEEKLRNHLIIFSNRPNTKRVHRFSNKDLKAITKSNDPVLKQLAKNLLQTRVLEKIEI